MKSQYIRTPANKDIYWQYLDTGESGNSVQTGYTRYLNKVDVWNGSVKGDRKRLIPNPFTFVITRAGWGNDVTELWSAQSGRPVYQRETSPFLPPGVDTADIQFSSADWTMVQNNSMAKIYDQLRGNNNLIVDLAESHSTVKMFKNVLNLKRFISDFLANVVKHKGYKKIKKSSTSGVSQGQRRLDYVNEKWLEYRYGWQPFVYSIYDAADNLNRQLRNETIYIKGRSGKRINSPNKVVTLPPGHFLDKDYFFEFRYEYGMLFNVPGGPKISDWTSLNPVGIAYELMTLSFVIDWVANIGQYLSLWENNALFSRDFRMGYGCSSWKEYFTYKISTGGPPTWQYRPDGTISSGGGNRREASAYCVRVSKDRVRLTSLPLPSGVTVKVRFGSLHQLDSIALFHQIIAKKMRG